MFPVKSDSTPNVCIYYKRRPEDVVYSQCWGCSAQPTVNTSKSGTNWHCCKNSTHKPKPGPADLFRSSSLHLEVRFCVFSDDESTIMWSTHTVFHHQKSSSVSGVHGGQFLVPLPKTSALWTCSSYLNGTTQSSWDQNKVPDTGFIFFMLDLGLFESSSVPVLVLELSSIPGT